MSQYASDKGFVVVEDDVFSTDDVPPPQPNLSRSTSFSKDWEVNHTMTVSDDSIIQLSLYFRVKWWEIGFIVLDVINTLIHFTE